MDRDQFQATAEMLLNELPARFRQAMENVVIVVEDFAATDVLEEMRASSPYDLLGLYIGQPLTEREAVAPSGMLPDMIYLYRLPILAVQREAGLAVESCIYDVLIHEIGHHFGFSDAQMQRFEAERGALQ